MRISAYVYYGSYNCQEASRGVGYKQGGKGMDLFDLHGKVAIVTGGNGGLGRGMAVGLASAGATIVIAARNQAKTAATAAELHQRYGVQVLELSVDVCEETAVRAMVDQTLHTVGRVDILVNN